MRWLAESDEPHHAAADEAAVTEAKRAMISMSQFALIRLLRMLGLVPTVRPHAGFSLGVRLRAVESYFVAAIEIHP